MKEPDNSTDEGVVASEDIQEREPLLPCNERREDFSGTYALRDPDDAALDLHRALRARDRQISLAAEAANMGFWFRDFEQEDFTKRGKRYDLILDTKTNRSPFKYLRALAPTADEAD